MKWQRQADDKACDVEEAFYRHAITTDDFLTMTHFTLFFFSQLHVDWLCLYKVLIDFYSASIAL